MPRNYLATKYGKYQQYERGNLPAAVAAVQTGGMSIRKAAAEFQVPRSTLADRISGRVDVDTSAGRQPVLPRKVEKDVVNLATLAAQKGIGVSR